MLRKTLSFLIIFFLAASAQALNRAGLEQRLSRLTATVESRVGVAFIDLKSGWSFSVNGSREFPAASIGKVPVMAAAYHYYDCGAFDIEKRVMFRESDKLEGAGVLRWMKGGREYSLWNLMRLMITLSDNTATRLVVNAVTLPSIEAYVKSIGLKQTRIVDPTMLVEPPDPNNNLTSPWDMAKQFSLIHNCRGFSKKSAKQMIAWLNYQRYRWGIWRGVPPGTYVANKTGQLEGILNDAGIIYTKKGNYVLSIFTYGFKKQRDARLLINDISRITYEEYTGEKVIKRKLSRRPSAKWKRPSGRRGSVSSRKSRTYRRR
ncbi:MAG: class A beta-lactamase-related serine hydrolase [Candidatus Margulisbacteria bacterium]|nr:class A beta-lactamase-related serine hydrolase [Candidatus Margulisiibacteriota bacterium]